MKRRIIFSLLWAATFAAATLLGEVLIYAALGCAGIAAWKQSTVVLIGRILSFLLFATPVFGLFLGLRGALPGTRRSGPPPGV